ncbi:MAG: glycosyltransferase family 87 protein [Myxococcota bacterium]
MTQNMPKWGVIAAQLAALLGVALLLGWVYGGWIGFSERFEPACAEPLCDWTRHYVPTAETILQDPKPLWGYLYPPTLAILIAPWAAAPWASWAWGALLSLSIAALCVVPPHLLPNTRPRTSVMSTALAAMSIPLLQSLTWGQVSSLLLLLGLISLVLLRRTPWLSGIFLGVAIALKLYPALWLPWLLRRRGWVATAVAVAVAVVLLAVLPVVVMGMGATFEFYQSVSSEITRMVPGFRKSVGPQSVPSVLIRVVLGQNELLRIPITVVSGLLGLAILGSLWWLPRWRPRDAAIWACVLAYASFPFFLESAWLHYFVQLPLMWLLALRALDAGLERKLGVGVLLAVSVGLGTWPMWVAVGPAWFPAFGLILLSHLSGLAALYLVLFDPRSAVSEAGSLRHSMGGLDSPSR